mmetsp:Transcript_5403/g.10296  ORF Transcript_5403/g.10296 Transcript_5403/m.10296 type:complete len:259 (+) Transcript_5403:339-1115(+)
MNEFIASEVFAVYRYRRETTYGKMSENNLKKVVKKKSRFRKAPGAPKRFKSAYIFFSTDMMQKIKKEQENSQSDREKITDISKRISQAWKDLSSHERQRWNLIAKRDKERFIREKMNYKGPWQLPVKIDCQDLDASTSNPVDYIPHDAHAPGCTTTNMKNDLSSFTDDSETTPKPVQPPSNDMQPYIVSQEERDAAHNLVTLFRQSNQQKSSHSSNSNREPGPVYGDFCPSLQLVMERNATPPITTFYPQFPRFGPFF